MNSDLKVSRTWAIRSRLAPIKEKARMIKNHLPSILTCFKHRISIVISYNPGYHSVLKDLKESTRQRFGAIDFNYPPPADEAAIIAHEAGVDLPTAAALVKISEKSRNLKGHGLDEGASTRL